MRERAEQQGRDYDTSRVTAAQKGHCDTRETCTCAQALLGMIHAQEMLMVSLIRALPPETRLRLVDEYQAQVERAELARVSPESERDTIEAFRAHSRKLSIVLASLA